MGYYSRHSIFLLKPDIQKLKLIQDLLEEKDIPFLILNDIRHRKQPFCILLGILQEKFVEVFFAAVKRLEVMLLCQTYKIFISPLLPTELERKSKQRLDE